MKTKEKRRQESNEKIKKRNIACFEELPFIKNSSEVILKDLDTVCQRAIACLLSIQLACDINDEKKEEPRELFSSLLKHYGVEDKLLEKEKRLFSFEYQEQDVIDITWTYEAYWALVWALGLVPTIEEANDICDCHKAITLVGDCDNYADFKKKCHLRDIEQILDMLDLYYRYHWACVEKRINKDIEIGKLNPDVVVERRRALEWLISKEEDWNNISLDT